MIRPTYIAIPLLLLAICAGADRPNSSTTTTATDDSTVSQPPVRFDDLTATAGFQTPSLTRARKYGGACVADLDGDGWPDLLLGNHNDRTYLYFNAGNGSFAFTPSSWSLRADAHGLAAFHLQPRDRHMHFVVTRGGANAQRPNSGLLFRVTPERKVVAYDSQLLYDARGRGRSVLPMYMNSDDFRSPDLLYVSARMPAFSPEHVRVLSVAMYKPLQFARRLSTAEAANDTDTKRDSDNTDNVILPALAMDNNHYATVTDYRNRSNNLLDIITFHKLRVYRRMRRSFRFIEVTQRVLPPAWRRAYGVRAIVELDYDNDGLWDIFVVRSRTNDLRWIQNSRHTLTDGLLRNWQGKRYADVTVRAGLDGMTSTGATAADFDNDGYVDLLITGEDGEVVLLRNKGDGTFERVVVGHTSKDGQGGQPVAVDIDRDGRVDVVVSDGHWFDERKGGTYRLWRNVSPTENNFLLVRVKASPGRGSASSLHAVVTACTETGAKGERGGEMRCQRRRVGTPGVATTPSYIETVHFGLGRSKRVASVSVRWINGVIRTKTDVGVNALIAFGS